MIVLLIFWGTNTSRLQNKNINYFRITRSSCLVYRTPTRFTRKFLDLASGFIFITQVFYHVLLLFHITFYSILMLLLHSYRYVQSQFNTPPIPLPFPLLFIYHWNDKLLIRSPVNSSKKGLISSTFYFKQKTPEHSVWRKICHSISQMAQKLKFSI